MLPVTETGFIEHSITSGVTFVNLFSESALKIGAVVQLAGKNIVKENQAVRSLFTLVYCIADKHVNLFY
jgi:hypothetical protein